MENALELPSKFTAKIELIIGNNEQRLIDDKFDHSVEKFKNECLNYGFYTVKYNDKISIMNTEYFLTHYPINHDKLLLHYLVIYTKHKCINHMVLMLE